MMRANSLAVTAGQVLRDVLFSTEADPYEAQRNEIVTLFLTQTAPAAGNILCTVFAGPVAFAESIIPVDGTGRTPVTPVTSQDPAIRIGLRKGERLKVGIRNTDGANAGVLHYLLSSSPA